MSPHNFDIVNLQVRHEINKFNPGINKNYTVLENTVGDLRGDSLPNVVDYSKENS